MHTEPVPSHRRTRVIFLLLDLAFVFIIARLFYWQVLNRDQLEAQAEQQYTRIVPTIGHRGKIYTSDGYLLVDNQKVYRLFATPQTLQENPNLIAQSLTSVLAQGDPTATTPAQLKEIQQGLQTKLSDPHLKWVALKNQVDENTKKNIEALNIHGLGFDEFETREYPEASMAAHVVGFVGKDKDGNDQGYFGIEGALDRELRAHSQEQTILKDALGFHLLFDQQPSTDVTNGRDVVLTIRRDIQYMLETMLQDGLQKYEASEGEAIVMDPKTGRILAMAATPSYDPAHFQNYDPSLYKNPALTDTYEPGSIFKILTVAAGIDTGAVKEDTQCTQCDGPRQIAGYTIKTWNEQYHPNITVTDALAKSDNVAMIFVSELIGRDRFVDYIHRFGIGEPTHVELQEDTGTPLRKDWKPIDLATTSFGQGIVTNGLQMVRAVGAIANGGVMMRPTIISKVIDPATGTSVPVDPIVERQVVSPQTAQTVTDMMVHSAETGESKWAVSKTHFAATKTGTAQVPIAGHYDPTKTIASFIGFAPPADPKFVMLIKLRDPQKSPWAAETAAPLWYAIAEKLYILLNVPADKN